MKIVIFDTETTGLLMPSVAPIDKQPRVIELGVVVIVDGKVQSEHNWIFDPKQSISAEITKITGITNEDLVGKPEFRERLAEIEEVFGGADIGIAHNAPFDTGMLKTELDLCGRTGFPWPAEMICTAQEYTHVLGKRPRLVDLYEHVMGRPLAQTHRALDDALAVWEVLEKDNFLRMIGA